MRITLSREEMTANILDVFDSANDRQVNDGVNWYRDSYMVAKALSDSSPYSIAQCAGVLAAVSPLNSWGNNVNLATRIIANRGNVYSGYLSKNLDKARAILADWQADIPSILGGNKVKAFYYSIVSSGQGINVCVDRHALSIAINERITSGSGLTDKQYRQIAEAFVAAAMERDCTPQEMQAITWVAWRNRYWAEGAFDGK